MIITEAGYKDFRKEMIAAMLLVTFSSRGCHRLVQLYVKKIRHYCHFPSLMLIESMDLLVKVDKNYVWHMSMFSLM